MPLKAAEEEAEEAEQAEEAEEAEEEANPKPVVREMNWEGASCGCLKEPSVRKVPSSRRWTGYSGWRAGSASVRGHLRAKTTILNSTAVFDLN
jgi:hypothetical protein